ncbi:MAG TPA: hypothetical protein VD968_08745, partial [Pyrinomonadaceae bacterium]|nr:hypothetical protein [Pyrinomonadaceae bacterium]
PVSMIVVCVVALLAGAGLGVVVLTLMRGDDTGAGARDTAQRRAAESEPAVRDEAAIGAAALPAEGAREQAASDDDALAAGTAEEAAAPGDARAELRGALESWLAATNARDLDSQMGFYDSTLEAFYLSRGASRSAVRAEKARAFSGASSVEVSAAEPEITLTRDGATAVMRFRKKYSVEGSGGARRGEVLQELRWRRTPRGWKIISERDLRVIR